jgi:hypothetical protein
VFITYAQRGNKGELTPDVIQKLKTAIKTQFPAREVVEPAANNQFYVKTFGKPGRKPGSKMVDGKMVMPKDSPIQRLGAIKVRYDKPHVADDVLKDSTKWLQGAPLDPAEVERVGRGHARLNNYLDKTAKGGLMRTAEADLLKELFKETDDKFLDGISLGAFKSHGDGTEAYSMLNSYSITGAGDVVRAPNRLAMAHPQDEGRAPFVFLHEYGHLGHGAILKDSERDVVKKAFKGMSYDERIEFFRRGPSGTAENSDYFAQNEQEFFAQAFAEYIITKGGRSYSPELMKIFERLIASLKKTINRMMNRYTPDQIEELSPLFDAVMSGKPTIAPV